jgi:hypothetical protein
LISLSLLISNFVSAAYTSDPDPFDFSQWTPRINSSGNQTWPLLLTNIPNPTPAFHGENYSNYIPPKNESKSQLDKILENPTTKYLFIIFIIIVVALIGYIYYKYSQGGDLITFDKDFGV